MADAEVLDQILDKLEQLAQRQADTNQWLEDLQQGQEALKQGQVETQKRLTTLEHRQETLEQGQGALSVALQKHATTTEEKLEDLQKTLTGFMSDAYDLHDKRITTLEEEVGIKPRKH